MRKRRRGTPDDILIPDPETFHEELRALKKRVKEASVAPVRLSREDYEVLLELLTWHLGIHASMVRRVANLHRLIEDSASLTSLAKEHLALQLDRLFVEGPRERRTIIASLDRALVGKPTVEIRPAANRSIGLGGRRLDVPKRFDAWPDP